MFWFLELTHIMGHEILATEPLIMVGGSINLIFDALNVIGVEGRFP